LPVTAVARSTDRVFAAASTPPVCHAGWSVWCARMPAAVKSAPVGTGRRVPAHWKRFGSAPIDADAQPERPGAVARVDKVPRAGL